MVNDINVDDTKHRWHEPQKTLLFFMECQKISCCLEVSLIMIRQIKPLFRPLHCGQIMRIWSSSVCEIHLMSRRFLLLFLYISLNTSSFFCKVRTASITCFAGITSSIFFSLIKEKQEFILSSLVNSDVPCSDYDMY